MKKIAVLAAILFSFGMLFWSCSEESVTEPEGNLTIELSQNSGAPGEIIRLTTNVKLENPEECVLLFGSQIVPFFPTDKEKEYDTVVPVVSKGNSNLCLTDHSGKESNILTFDILPLPDTGLPAGDVTKEFIGYQHEMIGIIDNVLIPNMNTVEIVNEHNMSLLKSEMMRAADIFEKMEIHLGTLTEEDRMLFDQILCTSGLRDLTKSHIMSLRKIKLDKSMYSGHHLIASMDAISAILSFSTRAIALGGAVASVASLGTLGPLVTVGVLGLSMIDNTIDGFLPTDLNELSVNIEDNPMIPLGGEKQIVIMGKFVPQSNPINASISTVVGILTTGIEIPGLYSYIITTLTEMGISTISDFSWMTENWQTVHWVEKRIDPDYYAGGLDAMLVVLGGSLGITAVFCGLSDALADLTGLNYRSEDETIAEFNDNNSSLIGLKTGNSKLIYNGYRFKPLDGWAGILGNLIGLEWPQTLEDDQIETFYFSVQEINGQFIDIKSNPSGASVYLDGTNMNVVTPIVINDVVEGIHTIRLYKNGYNEYNTQVSISSNAPSYIDADLGIPLPPMPEFLFSNPANGSTVTQDVLSVSGTIRLKDTFGNISTFTGTQAILTLNGIDQEIPVDNGFFNQQVLIRPGENTIKMRANNSFGDTGISEEITFYGEFSSKDIKMVLRWNNGTGQSGSISEMKDVDIHLFDNYDHHTYWLCSEYYYESSSHADAVANMVPGSYLDIDNTWGYGPETITVQNASYNTYYLAVHFYFGYDRYNPTYANMQIEFEGDSYTFGPQGFGNSYYSYNSTTGEYYQSADINDDLTWWDIIVFSAKDGKIMSFNENIPKYKLEEIKAKIKDTQKHKTK